MKILIHACPQRMWYVEEFLIPALLDRGADPADMEVWNDTKGKGNLISCMESFAAREGDGGTWHLQDDVLPCRDFVKRCEEYDEGVAFGFACRNFGDRLDAYGSVYVPDAWNSFQCVRIPDPWARECAKWVLSGAWERESQSPELPILYRLGKGDDTFFHEFMMSRHGGATAENIRPNLVEHIDWLIGGSSLQVWRDYLARAEYWEAPELVDELRARIKARNDARR